MAEFAGEFCCVDRIAVIVTRPVRHVADQRATRTPGGGEFLSFIRYELIKLERPFAFHFRN
jgi:hypothetical protein